MAFESRASNLVTPDTNLSSDIFLRDRQNNTTIRLSSDSFGAAANGDSVGPVLFGDGKWVAFSSTASNLVIDDTNGVSDVFLVEIYTGLITCVSRSVLGVEGNFESTQATISGDGRFVGFISQAANLVAGDTNGEPDAFVLDRQFALLRRVSLTSNGGQAAGWSSNLMLSADGHAAVFASAAANLVLGDNNLRVDIFAGSAGSGSMPAPYCVSSPNSLGCLPQLNFVGCPSASIGSGFTLSCTDVRNAQQGWIIYRMGGAASLPFQSGTLCVQPPFQATVMVPSGGHPPPWNLCDGALSLNFNAFAVGALGGTPDPALSIPGTQVFAQWMGSDPVPGSPNKVMLSNAASFQLAP